MSPGPHSGNESVPIFLLQKTGPYVLSRVHGRFVRGAQSHKKMAALSISALAVRLIVEARMKEFFC
jgi:hypothetical protein